MSNNENGTMSKLRLYIDAKDPFMSSGHQIKRRRRHERHVPAWAMDDEKIQVVLARSFPRLREDGSRDAAWAGRWARIIYLYFRMKHTHGQIAEELGVSYGKVRSLIRNIKRAFGGKRVDGRAMLGVRPNGRPKKATPQLKHLLEGLTR